MRFTYSIFSLEIAAQWRSKFGQISGSLDTTLALSYAEAGARATPLPSREPTGRPGPESFFLCILR
jgi:hypothetical protein